MNEKFKMLTSREESKLSKEELKYYYLELKKYLIETSKKESIYTGVQKMYGKLSPLLRKYSIYSISGVDNIPTDSSCVFYFNHSNSHDFYTIQEIFGILNKKVSVLAGSDCLNGISRDLFKAAGSVLIDRTNPVSCINGENELVRKIILGNNVVVFGESTWNLHPYKLMQPLRWGGTTIGIKSGGVPIIPAVIEYVENKNICNKEQDIYRECIIEFGVPQTVSIYDDFAAKTLEIEQQMINMRKKMKESYGNFYKSVEEVEPDIYINHTALKKNTTVFKLDADYESQFIRKIDNKPVENEFYLNESGLLVPKSKVLIR